MQNELFGREKGRARRDAALARVDSNTDPQWRLRVRVLCEDWLTHQPPAKAFTGEDLRLFCEATVPAPHHPNAWSSTIGHLIRGWVRDGRAQRHGSGEAADPKAHGRLVRVYRTPASQ